ncbi:hypothetical protein [Paraburkholderia adhaesiva]|uniref:hypothetical protein n=1 Tax=Paraburkholderia adhaesiva TaxID=2883244 RepID=UPI001F31EC62|nr:hypothetical protein [Paraburkholderia adhaesiva]
MLYRLRDAMRYCIVIQFLLVTISAALGIWHGYGIHIDEDGIFSDIDIIPSALDGINKFESYWGWWLLPLLAFIRLLQLGGDLLPWLPQTPGGVCLLNGSSASYGGYYVAGDDEESSSGHSVPYQPMVNIDGSPMCGSVDIHGCPYGSTDPF